MTSATTTKQLSPRQLELCKLIRDFTDRQGYPPTLRECGAEMSIHPTRVRALAIEARNRGHVTFVDGAARTLRVVSKNPSRK
jgi:SOS-response transcriptional repressor LexA